jgi:hypothetical protein
LLDRLPDRLVDTLLDRLLDTLSVIMSGKLVLDRLLDKLLVNLLDIMTGNLSVILSGNLSIIAVIAVQLDDLVPARIVPTALLVLDVAALDQKVTCPLNPLLREPGSNLEH